MAPLTNLTHLPIRHPPRQPQIGFWGVFVALCAARSHMDSVAADGWLDSPGPFSW